MKLFRNTEIKLVLLIYAALSVAFIIFCSFFEPLLSLAAFVFACISAAVFLIFTQRRYKKIEALTKTVDSVLQGKERLKINSMKEGELSILETQIEKVLIRLSEQKDILQKDKSFLADSIADLSHQLRTPLTSINLILSRLYSHDLTDEERNSLLRELSSLIDRTENLVTTLLKISKIDAGAIQFKNRDIKASELIKKAAEPLLIQMDLKNISFLTEAEEISFKGDFMWHREALSNIIKNAVEHTPENGRVTVKASDNPLYTQITVTDTGTGLSESDIPHIFERFYKGKNTDKESFGIGLNLAKSIIENQRGTVKAQNSADCGAMFTVKIYKSDETVI